MSAVARSLLMAKVQFISTFGNENKNTTTSHRGEPLGKTP